MDYAGRARKPQFTTKINGTHTLTFEMPDKYFDSKIGDYIHNEFVDAIFAEKKVKLFYKEKWYEFYVKNISEVKNFKSFMRTYSCSDAFIDELARNGYGITFDEELYNNVDEIGTFTTEILEDSVWEYDAAANWGDFTEYVEEKLFKIPLSLFGGSINAYKLNFELEDTYTIHNLFTGEERAAEMGDDLAHEKGEYWNSYEGKNDIFAVAAKLSSKDNQYIYVPYSQLDFCYVSSELNNGLSEAFAATEYPAQYEDKGYALAPSTIDPNKLIQFIFIPEDEKIEIDEAGLILNKNYTYIIPLSEWNKQLESNWFYKFEDYKEEGQKKKVLTDNWTDHDYIYGNKALYYDGYLEEVNTDREEVVEDGRALTIVGKKIPISDRTEINISEDIDQYVIVYNNKATEYADLYINEDWTFNPETDAAYRVCSKEETRQIVPQLARNLLQNATTIQSTTGWEVMRTCLNSKDFTNAKIGFDSEEQDTTIHIDNGDYTDITIKEVKEAFLTFVPAYEKIQTTIGEEIVEGYKVLSLKDDKDKLNEQQAIMNFGIVGQQKTLEKGKTYVLSINIRDFSDQSKSKNSDMYEAKEEEGTITYKLKDNFKIGKLSDSIIRIGSGKMIGDGDYQFDKYIDISISKFLVDNEYKGYIFIRLNETYENPYLAIYSTSTYELISCQLFEAYTKGLDQFDDGYFKYSGRDIFANFTPIEAENYSYSNLYTKEALLPYVIFEDDVFAGDTYAYRKYFIQQLKLNESGQAFDTFGAKKYTDENADFDAASLPLNAGQYTEDDYKILTNYIDLNNCSFYSAAAGASEFDCKCGSDTYDKVCLYQKYGYCPYRFQTEKHCRRIRTLKGEKSNRFNLTQEVGKVFKIYPVYWISHSSNGKVLTQQEAFDLGLRSEITAGREDWMDKRIFYITEKGKRNQLGFRYEKNLTNISRTINSDSIVSKLYVLDVDSQISKTGLSTIKTAEDNPSKDNFIIDFSYYIAQGLLDGDKVSADLYGINNEDLGYLKYLGYLNTQYDILSNKIINLSSASYAELKANLDVNLTGIETAQNRLRTLERIMSQCTIKIGDNQKESPTYNSYQYEYIEQNAILVNLIKDTFYTDGICIDGSIEEHPPADFLKDRSIEQIKKEWLDTHTYEFGLLGQFNAEYKQIKEWTKEQSLYLRKINELSQKFYRKYEPFLKEGTWSDNNYITDNAYYYGALEVAKQGCIPKVSYSITVCDIEPLYLEGDYDFEVADTTYVEDIGLFGINKKTGLPNKLKALISATIENPDQPQENKIEVQNFTTQFEDLFQQITATVQTLSFNENIYNRSSNFTSLQNIEKSSLQGTLDSNDLTLLRTEENNIELDQTGQSGSDLNNHSNKYKLNGQGLFFSNNGGQSWNVGVGPNGINADYIKTGTLDASKIRIVDGQYIYFGWDKNGLTAYRDPKTITKSSSLDDYAQFNRFGLSLVENGQIKLRVGYAFSGKDGIASTETSPKEDTPIGFYLYNSAGNPIFSTENAKDANNAARQTARINLIGEMFATNDATVIITKEYKYGGQAYTASSKQCYDIGDATNLLYRPNVSISENIATYTKPADSPYSNSELAAAIAYFYKNSELTQINIIDNEDTFEYTNINTIITGSDDVLGILNQNRYCKFRNGVFSYTLSGLDGTVNFVIVDEKAYKTFTISPNIINKIMLTPYVETGSSKDQAPLTSVSGIENIIHQDSPDSYQYYQEISLNNYYKINNNYYSEPLGSTQEQDDGQVALYINNASDLLNEQTTAEAEQTGIKRLFVSCISQKETQSVYNIFSLLKDGSLHMGGTITNAQEASKLGDTIEFGNHDEYLVIKDGKLHMAFDKIMDMDENGGQSIVNYITSQMGNQKEDIIGDITGRSHNHEMSYQTVDWNRPYSGDFVFGNDVNFEKVKVILKYDENGQTYEQSLADLLNTIGYYRNIYYYGGQYTGSASV